MMGSFKPILLSLVIFSSVFGFNTLNADDHKIISISTFPIETRFSKCAKNMVSELYKAIGYDVAFRHLPGERSLAEVNAGNINAELMRIDQMEQSYKNLVKVPTPLFRLNARAFTVSSDIVINTWDDLLPYRVAYELGFKFAERRVKGEQIFKASNGWHPYVMLANDKVDVVIDVSVEADENIKMSKVKRTIHAQPSILDSEYLFHYIHKSKRHLVKPLNRAMANMQAKDGELSPCE